MKRMDFPIVGSYHEDEITKIDAERTINMYQAFLRNGKKPTYLHPTPGKLEINSFSAGGIGRASFVFKPDDANIEYTYFVVGDTIYRMDSTLIPQVIALNFFTTTTGYVGISANEFQILFVDGIKCFLWNTLTSTGIDNTPNLPAAFAPLDITFMDGSFILISSTTGKQNRFYVSALSAGQTWPVLDFALINSRPTILAAVKVLKRRIFFFGKKETELWVDAGLSDFRFRRDNNLLLEHGVKAIGSVYEAFDSMFYLSGDINGVGSIMMVAGGITPVPISTTEMDDKIQNFVNPADAVGFVYKINGLIFYQISFTTDQHTFVFNATNSDPEKGILLWHELEMADETRDIANTHAFFVNKHYITSYLDNKLYQISGQFLTNNGERIKRTRITRVGSVPTYDRITYARLQIDMLEGVGKINQKPVSSIPLHPLPSYMTLANASDVNPICYLSISQDGGITYISLGSATTGEAGQRLHRVLWFDIGTYRDAIFKWEMYNAVPTYVLGGAIDMEVQEQ